VDDERQRALGEFERLALTERQGSVRVPIHVRPRSSRSAVLGVREGSLEIALTSAPTDGEANAELMKLLSKALDVRRTSISIAIGASSRSKVIEVMGMDAAEARVRLGRAKR
jgi:uncharacterized protein